MDLLISTKLIDFKSKEVVGVICSNITNSVALSLDKAKELNIQDIDIIQYLDAEEREIVINPRRNGYFAFTDSSIGDFEEYSDEMYERMGSFSEPLTCKEIIWGMCFNYMSFIELDSKLAIDNALIDKERN